MALMLRSGALQSPDDVGRRGVLRDNVSSAPLQWDPALRREYAALRRFGYDEETPWETP